MKSFTDFLSETFDTKPVLWTKIKEGFYKFSINHNDYVVMFQSPLYDSKPTKVDFGLIKDGDVVFTLTKTGETFSVLSTVIDVIKSYILENNPAGLSFSARKEVNIGKDSSSRASVYLRLVTKNFSPLEWDIVVKDKGLHVDFTIMRK